MLRSCSLLLLLSASLAVAAPLEYRVQPGDTAYSLARRSGLSVEALLARNGLSGPELSVGQVLLIDTPDQAPPAPAPTPSSTLVPSTYIVVAGDTLYSIAHRHGLNAEWLLALNGLSTPYLKPGQVLALSPAPEVGPPVLATPSQTPAQTVETLQALALQFLNVPYVYGGTTRQGLDCSGLVLQVFTPLGLSLPRRSEDQFRAGTPVDRSDLRPGDLVFFDTAGASEATHVGILLRGDEFINANSYDGRVTLNHLSEKYYEQRYLGARRVLPVLALH